MACFSNNDKGFLHTVQEQGLGHSLLHESIPKGPAQALLGALFPWRCPCQNTWALNIFLFDSEARHYQRSWGLVKRLLGKLTSLWLTWDMQGENTLRLKWFAAGASWGIDWASVSSSTVLEGLTRWRYSEGTGWLAEEGSSLETVDWKLVFSQSLSPRRW